MNGDFPTSVLIFAYHVGILHPVGRPFWGVRMVVGLVR